MNIRLLFLFITIAITGCNSNPSNSNSTYLNKPSGPYSVGFQDYHYINQQACPDTNYVPNLNESYFSPENTNYCHEIMLRVYYPTDTKISKTTTSYYYPAILQIKNTVSLDQSISTQQIESLNFLTSWTLESASITSGTFPIVMFIPGSQDQVQTYENLITNLVSYGYIVVGINSLFINGDIELPNGTVVPGIVPNSESDAYRTYFPEQYKDVEFIYHQIKTNHNLNIPIFKTMDLNHIGAFAHSLGNLSVIHMAHENPTLFKSVISLDDAIVDAYLPTALESIPNPTLYQFAALTYTNLRQSHQLPNLIESSEYLAVISPNAENESYSYHMNFSDFSTLQYHPTITKFFDYLSSINQPIVSPFNGYDITHTIDIYLVSFFNTYLKDESSTIFNTDNCKPLTNNSFVFCGPHSND